MIETSSNAMPNGTIFDASTNVPIDPPVRTRRNQAAINTLARPFGSGVHTSFVDDVLSIETTTLVPGQTYRIAAADSATGPFETVPDGLSVPKYQRATFTIAHPDRAFYQLVTP